MSASNLYGQLLSGAIPPMGGQSVSVAAALQGNNNTRYQFAAIDQKSAIISLEKLLIREKAQSGGLVSSNLNNSATAAATTTGVSAHQPPNNDYHQQQQQTGASTMIVTGKAAIGSALSSSSVGTSTSSSSSSLSSSVAHCIMANAGNLSASSLISAPFIMGPASTTTTTAATALPSSSSSAAAAASSSTAGVNSSYGSQNNCDNSTNSLIKPRLYLISSDPKQPEMYELSCMNYKHQQQFIERLKSSIDEYLRDQDDLLHNMMMSANDDYCYTSDELDDDCDDDDCGEDCDDDDEDDDDDDDDDCDHFDSSVSQLSSPSSPHHHQIDRKLQQVISGGKQMAPQASSIDQYSTDDTINNSLIIDSAKSISVNLHAPKPHKSCTGETGAAASSSSLVNRSASTTITRHQQRRLKRLRASATANGAAYALELNGGQESNGFVDSSVGQQVVVQQRNLFRVSSSGKKQQTDDNKQAANEDEFDSGHCQDTGYCPTSSSGASSNGSSSGSSSDSGSTSGLSAPSTASSSLDRRCCRPVAGNNNKQQLNNQQQTTDGSKMSTTLLSEEVLKQLVEKDRLISELCDQKNQLYKKILPSSVQVLPSLSTLDASEQLPPEGNSDEAPAASGTCSSSETQRQQSACGFMSADDDQTVSPRQTMSLVATNSINNVKEPFYVASEKAQQLMHYLRNQFLLLDQQHDINGAAMGPPRPAHMVSRSRSIASPSDSRFYTPVANFNLSQKTTIGLRPSIYKTPALATPVATRAAVVVSTNRSATTSSDNSSAQVTTATSCSRQQQQSVPKRAIMFSGEPSGLAALVVDDPTRGSPVGAELVATTSPTKQQQQESSDSQLCLIPANKTGNLMSTLMLLNKCTSAVNNATSKHYATTNNKHNSSTTTTTTSSYAATNNKVSAILPDANYDQLAATNQQQQQQPLKNRRRSKTHSGAALFAGLINGNNHGDCGDDDRDTTDGASLGDTSSTNNKQPPLGSVGSTGGCVVNKLIEAATSKCTFGQKMIRKFDLMVSSGSVASSSSSHQQMTVNHSQTSGNNNQPAPNATTILLTATTPPKSSCRKATVASRLRKNLSRSSSSLCVKGKLSRTHVMSTASQQLQLPESLFGGQQQLDNEPTNTSTVGNATITCSSASENASVDRASENTVIKEETKLASGDGEQHASTLELAPKCDRTPEEKSEEGDEEAANKRLVTQQGNDKMIEVMFKLDHYINIMLINYERQRTQYHQQQQQHILRKSHQSANDQPTTTTTVSTSNAKQQHQLEASASSIAGTKRQQKCKNLRKLSSVSTLTTTSSATTTTTITRHRNNNNSNNNNHHLHHHHHHSNTNNNGISISSSSRATINNQQQLMMQQQQRIRRTTYRPEQKLEELRDIQLRLDRDKEEWHAKYIAMQEELSKERKQLDEMRDKLKSERAEIREEREQLYRKLDLLKDNGILLSPSHTLITTTPLMPRPNGNNLANGLMYTGNNNYRQKANQPFIHIL